jgi:hypothetical protein
MIPGVDVAAGESVWLPLSVSIGPEGLCRDCTNFAAPESYLVIERRAGLGRSPEPLAQQESGGKCDQQAETDHGGHKSAAAPGWGRAFPFSTRFSAARDGRCGSAADPST